MQELAPVDSVLFGSRQKRQCLNHSTEMKKQTQTEHMLLPSISPRVTGFNKIKTLIS